MKNNPFAMQYKGVQNNRKSIDNTKGNTNKNTERNTKSNTNKSNIVKSRALRQSFSMKLDKVTSDKMITYCIENDLKFTDLIEHCLEEFFNENNVDVNENIIEEYYENRSRKKSK